MSNVWFCRSIRTLKQFSRSLLSLSSFFTALIKSLKFRIFLMISFLPGCSGSSLITVFVTFIKEYFCGTCNFYEVSFEKSCDSLTGCLTSHRYTSFFCELLVILLVCPEFMVLIRFEVSIG
jgi:hypothetical protein